MTKGLNSYLLAIVHNCDVDLKSLDVKRNFLHDELKKWLHDPTLEFEFKVKKSIFGYWRNLCKRWNYIWDGGNLGFVNNNLGYRLHWQHIENFHWHTHCKLRMWWHKYLMFPMPMLLRASCMLRCPKLVWVDT
mgnify:FL=1